MILEDGFRVQCGDCLELMGEYPENTFDSIVTDPPYGLSFMGAKWDSFGGQNGRETIEERREKMNRYLGDKATVPRFASSHGHVPKLSEMVSFQQKMTPIFEEALRVAKHGAYLLCFGGTRTFHRMACAIEDAGWIIKDCIMWVYGSGMLHGQRVDRLMEKAYPESAGEWRGWNTGLKPSWEPIIVAQKPLDGTIAHNVMTYGTGGINVDGCRVGTEVITTQGGDKFPNLYGKHATCEESRHVGRFPANLVHDGSDEVLELFPDSKGQQGDLTGTEPSKPAKNVYGKYDGHSFAKRGDNGSAARFFYCAKASKKDRNSGVEDLLTWEQGQELTRLLEASSQLVRDISGSMTPSLDDKECNTYLFGSDTTGLSQTECRFITSMVTRLITESKTSNSSLPSNTNGFILDAIRTSEESGTSLAQLADKLRSLRLDSTREETDTAISAVSALFDALCEIRRLARKGNFHPTIKPSALMQWLVRLVTRPGGVVLDPFAGSGSTGVAAVREGMSFVGMELDEGYCEVARSRIGEAAMQPSLGF